MKVIEIIAGQRYFNSEPFYLEWLNNYGTVANIAEYYNIPESLAEILINAGRFNNHLNAQKNGTKNSTRMGG